MRVLVLGASGMLGTDLVRILRDRDHDVTPFTSKDLDLTNHKAVRDCGALSKKRHDWVVNCAAYTAVDQAELEPELAWDVNEEGVLNLAEKLENGPRLIHISTDFVFDGSKTTPYTEEDEPNPISIYGQTKLGGERYVEAMIDDAVILRTSWLYGPNGKSFPKTMINAYEAGKTLRVVSDKVGCPTYTKDLAMAITEAIEMNIPGGIYHAAGPDAQSWHDFAELTLSTWRGEPVSIEPIPTSAYPTPAQRPNYSVLDTGKLAALGISPWRSTAECLKDFCQDLKAQGL
ncbi:MAG: dTDP-4-dehydrorhamnose reductase [Armatimonadetes bacterium]|nr:dTDP-4-dehydrorhamnose reductase [Armatimonadota bacterium]